ncbi:MAG: NAD(P)/FAD-dependent oxidoreductase [Phycisphaerae bacterium]|nr:NAD(P)/FAD-dependent oxidoreductase [Phycisphaerae bacterium]
MTEKRLEFDIAIVGAGPASIAAACIASESGKTVVMLEASPWLGGQLWRSEFPRAKTRQAIKWFTRLSETSAKAFLNTTVIDAPEEKTLLAETSDGNLRIVYDKLILATGAREIFLPFPGWTLPNVYGAGAMQALAKVDWPVDGKRVAIVGSGPLLFAVAANLRKRGAKVVLTAEQTDLMSFLRFGMKLPLLAPSKILQAIEYNSQLIGVPYRTSCWPVEAHGTEQLESVTFTNGKKKWNVECDYLACAFGLTGNLELPRLLGCEIDSDAVTVNDYQQTSLQDVYCAGEPTGIGGIDSALTEGLIAGLVAAGNVEQAKTLFGTRDRYTKFEKAMAKGFALRDELLKLATAETIVCRCEDVTAGQLAEFDDWKSAKLQTRCGMGPCQGRICGCAVKAMFGWENKSVRPPVYPTKMKNLE